MRILAVVPARGGSKGIPNKNIRNFAGKPLIVHAIEHAKNAPSVDRIIVSTDDEKIAAVARSAGAEVPFLRPAELASDSANIVDALVHLLGRLKKDEGYEPSHLLMLQPTSPLRTSQDIERSVQMLVERGADGLVSVCGTENLLLTKAPDDRLTILNSELLFSPNRQALPKYFKLDGCMIYLVTVAKFLAEKSFFKGHLIGYEIPRWKAVDLDEIEDFVVGELVYANRANIESAIESSK